MLYLNGQHLNTHLRTGPRFTTYSLRKTNIADSLS